MDLFEDTTTGVNLFQQENGTIESKITHLVNHLGGETDERSVKGETLRFNCCHYQTVHMEYFGYG